MKYFINGVMPKQNKKILKDLGFVGTITKIPNPLTLDAIIDLVSAEQGLSRKIMTSKSRETKPYYCRVLYCMLAKKYTGNSLQEIGDAVGLQNHASVLNCLYKGEGFIEKKYIKTNLFELLK